MIVSFRHKGLEAFYKTGSARGIQPKHAKKLAWLLDALAEAAEPQELSGLQGLRLHALHGNLAGYWSVWVNGNWRVTFRFIGSDVELVDYQDYH